MPAWTVCCVWPEPSSESLLSSAHRRGSLKPSELYSLSSSELASELSQSGSSIVRYIFSS